MRKLLFTLFVAVCASDSFAYYQAQQGRWMSRDPKVEEGGKNLYAFNYNNAIIYIDPDGRAPQLIGVNPDGSGIYGPDQDWGDYDPMWGGRGAGQGAADMGTAWFAGGEGHFFIGGGITRVSCCDEKDAKRKMVFRKVCFGGALGVSGSVGVISGMEGEKCRPDSYKGWFYELGGSLPWWGAGVDIGYQDMWEDNPNNPLPPMPGDFSGVNEGGTGPGRGLSFKSTWCRYTLINEEIEPCGCKK